MDCSRLSHICAIVLMIAPAFGNVEIRPSGIEGVELIPVESAEGQRVLSQIIQSTVTISAIGPILPYSAIVHFTGAKDIRWLAIRYESGPLDARRSAGVFAWGPSKQRPFELVTPSGPSILFRSNYPMAVARLGAVQAAEKLVVEVDAVAYSDGEFVGPDHSNYFEYLVAQGASDRRFVRELEGLRAEADDRIAERLREALRAQPPIIAGRRLNLELLVILLSELEKSGRAQFEKGLLSLILRPRVPDVWRR